MIPESAHSYRFKSFRLDLLERQLVHNGKPVSLTPKAFDVLAALVERSGHLVEKDDLLRSVWPDSFVEESNIARIVHTLRKVLGEDENGNKFIDTVAKRGYRFVAEVEVLGEEVARSSELSPASTRSDVILSESLLLDTPLESAPVRSVLPLADSPKISARAVLFVVGFLTAITLLLLLSFNSRTEISPTATSVRSVAVLPLSPVNAGSRDSVYELGIADSLIHRLSSMKGFLVRPLSSTRKYADIEQDAIAVGKEQRVDFVLASNYQLADGKIRITSQLFNVATGQIEETYKGDKEAADLFGLQDAFSDEIAGILEAHFATTSVVRTARPETTNEESYRAYLQGMFLYDQRNAEGAIETFRQAVTLDPNYALAWAGKAHAHRIAAWTRVYDAGEEYQSSMEAARKALSMDPNLSEAYSAICENKFAYEFDFAGAELDCKRALVADPNSPVAHNIYSVLLAGRGRFEEAIAEVKTAIDLEPTSYFNQKNYANMLFIARRYEDAVSQYRRLIDTNYEDASTYQWLVRTLEMQGKESEAFGWFVKSLKVEEKDDRTIRNYKAIYRRSGWRGVLLEREKSCDKANSNCFRCAAWSARVGDNDKAFEYLQSSYRRREGLMNLLQVEPEFDTLRSDPRFDALVRQLEGDQ